MPPSWMIGQNAEGGDSWLMWQGLLDVVAHEVAHRLKLTQGRPLPTDNSSSSMFTRQHLVWDVSHELQKPHVCAYQHAAGIQAAHLKKLLCALGGSSIIHCSNQAVNQQGHLHRQPRKVVHSSSMDSGISIWFALPGLSLQGAFPAVQPTLGLPGVIPFWLRGLCAAHCYGIMAADPQVSSTEESFMSFLFPVNQNCVVYMQTRESMLLP